MKYKERMHTVCKAPRGKHANPPRREGKAEDLRRLARMEPAERAKLIRMPVISIQRRDFRHV